MNNESREYEKNIKAIKEILSGKKNLLKKQLEKEMQKYAKEEKFEEALKLQYKIGKLKRVFQNATIIKDRGAMIYHSTESITKQLQKLFHLPSIPQRIECYDIANIQDKYAVGAMIVFTNGKPDKNQYRKFKILKNESQNKPTSQVGLLRGDAGMLREVLIRRFNHSEWSSPDLIIVDGGKQQLNVVKAVVNSKSQIPNHKQTQNSEFKIPIIALTKNEKHIGNIVIKITTEYQKYPPPNRLRSPPICDFVL